MRAKTTTIALAFLSMVAVPIAHAGSLQVAPISIEMKAPAMTSSVTLRNPGKAPIKAQVRVFRWTQTNGQERLEPARDVVASPPMATVAPNKDYVVRLVRLSKKPVATEETYRIIVDELPDPSQMRGTGLNIAFRYSIPVFVMPQDGAKPALSWSVAKREGKTIITAANNGDRRVRISDLQVSDAKGKPLIAEKGLAGYVLARSSMSWVAPGTAQASGNSPVLITAQGDQGAINAEARTEAAR